MKKNSDVVIEKIKSEIEDDYSDDSLFNIVSWGADLSFRELVNMYEEGELIKPELQRKYVWDRVEASRFIESILLGLPIPSIFLAVSGSQKLIVDGYQRIMTVRDYMRGFFSTDGKAFKLSNLEKINPRWRNKSFEDLSQDEQRKIRGTTIHSIVFEQRKPEDDDASLYQVFERINTGGQALLPQEIRNCIYQGSFNAMLFRLNENKKWRDLFGSEGPDNRMRDLEYILRFFVLKSYFVAQEERGRVSLKKALNGFMSRHKNDDESAIHKFEIEFNETIDSVYEKIGVNAFRGYSRSQFSRKFHPAIYDAIMISIFLIKEKGCAIGSVSEEMHKSLVLDQEFKDVVSRRTTDIENLKKRIRIVAEHLYGISL